ncbi:uncharacterized protein LOC129717699 isoform X2 [Wyeomyia smithii]|uniref:uncharacterized protein LOC129717699 isoform X2 n=1 Tax=Wyeomyia smithii TaxID=174621 RepID=UPI002467BE37|nr:uncharacterized protein LOC129717699 isoform X2 [Wyeomyia smithii]
MKKFITTKLHTASMKEVETEAEVENDETAAEEIAATDQRPKKLAIRRSGGIVRSKSLSSATGTSSLVASSAAVVTVMTLNSAPSSPSLSVEGVTDERRSNVTVDDPPPTLIQPKQPQQSKVQPQHAIITISKPKPPPSFFGSSTSFAAQVKMCGYLKKKRNMGGWRKMYFILQNQLLLSYSSKDDYEKKLAPFKDIINLVPGTVIIPTTGPRFTIETNSKVLYTFRCDDHKSCSEWITALLDSLKGDGGGGIGDKKYSRTSLHGVATASGGRNLQQHHPTMMTRRSLSSLSSSSSSASSIGSSSAATGHYATDDPSKMAISSIRRLQHNMPPYPTIVKATSAGMRQQQASSLSAPNLYYGFGSITNSGQNVKVGKLVQLPIASGTARLLERGAANGAQKKYKILTINEVDDDGENDEKPASTPSAVPVAAAAVVARAISNGNLGRGDSKGIKATTTTTRTSNSLGEELNEAGRRWGADQVKHVKSSGAAEESSEATTALGNNNNNNNNFRLHTDRERMHQSVEVCRINSMFIGGGEAGAGGSKLEAPTLVAKRISQRVAGGQSVENVVVSLAASTGDLRRFGSSLKSARGSAKRTNSSVTDLRVATATAIGSARPDLLLPAMMMDSKPLADINHNHLAKWSAESITISLTKNGFTLSGRGAGRSVGSTDTLYRSAKAASAAGLTASTRLRSNSHSSDLHKSSQNYSSRTELNRSSPKKLAGNASGEPPAAEKLEPIYAVVDLSLKKSRRLNLFGHGSLEPDLVEGQRIKVEMIRDRETGRLQEKANAVLGTTSSARSLLPTSNNDYEELSELTIENFSSFGDDQDNSNDSENIYEPINIPEIPLSSSNASPSATPSQMNTLWRHLKKMNINQLMKRHPESPTTANPAVQHSNQRDEEGPKASTFSELSKKFGHHRRSIKNRMRVLVDRQHSHPPSTATGLGTQNSSLTSLPKTMTESDDVKMLRKASADSRPLFSTFGRNKKSRKSLSFDDFIPRKKQQQQQQQQHVGGVGLVICKTAADSSRAHDELHRELKRQLSKRSDSSSASAASSGGHENKNSLEL